jgi:hypothetical protein
LPFKSCYAADAHLVVGSMFLLSNRKRSSVRPILATLSDDKTCTMSGQAAAKDRTPDVQRPARSAPLCLDRSVTHVVERR